MFLLQMTKLMETIGETLYAAVHFTEIELGEAQLEQPW